MWFEVVMTRISAALFALLAGSAFADIAPEPFAAAGEPRPLSVDGGTVEMTKEEVVITLHDGFAVVDATFVMTNKGDADAAINVGFPGEGVVVRGGRGHLAHRPLLGFRAWVDGKNANVEAKKEEIVTKSGPPGREYSKRREETWHVFAALFPKQKATTVRVRYAVLADGYRGDSWRSDEVFQDGAVSYVLATGARWSGKIGEAVVRVKAGKGTALDSVRVRDNKMPPFEKRMKPADKPARVLPAYGKANKSEVVLTRSELEPTVEDNVEIVFRWKTPRRDWRTDPAGAAKVTELATREAQR